MTPDEKRKRLRYLQLKEKESAGEPPAEAAAPAPPVPVATESAPIAAPAADQPSTARDLLDVGVEGFFKGGSDELAGATAPAKLAAAGPGATIRGPDGKDYSSGADLYRARRDARRDQVKGARERLGFVPSMAAEVGGDVLSDVALSRIPGIGPAVFSPAGQAAIGAVSGALGNEADITKGDAGSIASTLGSAGVGGGLGYLFPKIGARFKGASAAKAGVARAEADALGQATKAADKALASKRGALGSEVQAGSRDLEVILREAEAAAETGVGEAADKARAFLASEGGKALRESVLLNKLESAPQRIANVTKLKAELAEAVGNRGRDIAQGAEELLADPVRKQLIPRLKTYASRALPIAAGTALSGAVGGWPGMIAGGLLGTGAAAAMGRPGTALANAMKSPGVRKAMWELLEGAGVGAGAALGGLGPAAVREFQRLAPDEDAQEVPPVPARFSRLVPRGAIPLGANDEDEP